MSTTRVTNQLIAFKTWKCPDCAYERNDGKSGCDSCIKKAKVTSIPTDILNMQQLLFDGYFRTNILNNISSNASNIMSTDIVNLCNKFFIIQLSPIMEQFRQELLKQEPASHTWLNNEDEKVEVDLYTLEVVSDAMIKNKEHYLADKILKILVKYEDKPGQAHCHYLMGGLLFSWNAESMKNDTKALNEAVNEYEAAIDIATSDDHRSIYRFNLGCKLKGIEKYKLALDRFKFLIESDNNSMDDECMNQCGICYGLQGDKNNAEKYLKMAIAKNSKNVRFHLDLASFYKDIAEDYGRAKESYEAVISLEPENTDACYQCAKICRDYLFDYNESEKHFMKLVEIDGEYKHAYGYLLYLMGKYDKALECINARLEVNDGNPWVYLYLALINASMGHKDVVEKMLTKAVKLIKESKWVEYVLEQVTKLKQNDKSNTACYDKFIELLSSE